jgi:REP element-mobilizing transposase RayT
MTEHREFYRRHLPHWQPDGAMLFVTFRLAGSLPNAVIAALEEQCERQEEALRGIQDVQERRKQSYLNTRRVFGRWDTALDNATTGPQWLAKSQIAAVVVEALHYRHDRVYDLVAFCVMPNHVHLVCTPLKCEDGTYYALRRILQSLKRYTARESNKILQRRGAFWQAESYDHVVRDEAELMRIIQYVLDNPVKAGLVPNWEAWPWIYTSRDIVPIE